VLPHAAKEEYIPLILKPLFLASSLIDKHICSNSWVPALVFYNFFIWYSSLSRTSWHPLVNHRGLDTLPLIHIC